MYKIIYNKGKNQYSVIFTNPQQEIVLYMMYKLNKRIVFFDTLDEAQIAVENLGKTELSQYFMGQ